MVAMCVALCACVLVVAKGHPHVNMIDCCCCCCARSCALINSINSNLLATYNLTVSYGELLRQEVLLLLKIC